jgi:hypothetical protein
VLVRTTVSVWAVCGGQSRLRQKAKDSQVHEFLQLKIIGLHALDHIIEERADILPDRHGRNDLIVEVGECCVLCVRDPSPNFVEQKHCKCNV